MPKTIVKESDKWSLTINTEPPMSIEQWRDNANYLKRQCKSYFIVAENNGDRDGVHLHAYLDFEESISYATLYNRWRHRWTMVKPYAILKTCDIGFVGYCQKELDIGGHKPESNLKQDELEQGSVSYESELSKKEKLADIEQQFKCASNAVAALDDWKRWILRRRLQDEKYESLYMRWAFWNSTRAEVVEKLDPERLRLIFDQTTTNMTEEEYHERAEALKTREWKTVNKYYQRKLEGSQNWHSAANEAIINDQCRVRLGATVRDLSMSN